MLSRVFSRREKTLLVILALLLLFAFYYLVIEIRIGGAVEEYRERIEFDEQQFTVLSAKVQKMHAMQAELDEILREDDPVIVPDYDNLEEVMIFLNTVLSVTDDYTVTFGTAQMPSEGNYIVCRDAQILFVVPDYGTAKGVIRDLQDSHFCCRLSNLSAVPFDPGYRYAPITDGSLQVSVSMSFYESGR